MRRIIETVAAVALIFVIVLAVNLISSLLLDRAKVDLTEEKLYSLSDGSRSLLESLDENERLSATLYYSKTAAMEVPSISLYAKRVIALLKEYEAASDGQFQLTVIDVRPDTDDQLRAERYQLASSPGGRNGERIYLGLVIKDEAGNEDTISFFSPQSENLLEYDITKAIYNVSHPEKKRVALITSLPVMGEPEQQPPFSQRRPRERRPWAVILELQNYFDLVEVEPTAVELPEDIDLVMLIHPKGLSPELRFAIDQYVLTGGTALAFVDSMCEADLRANMGNAQMMQRGTYHSEIDDLLESWGVQIVKGAARSRTPGMGSGSGLNTPSIVADPDLAAEFRDERGQSITVFQALVLGPEQLNSEEVVTAGLDTLILPAAAALEPATQSPEVTLTPLLETTDQSGFIDGAWLMMGADPSQLNQTYDPDQAAKRVLAYKASGLFRTAFPDGPIAGGATTGTAAQPLSESSAESAVVVVGDADLLSDRYSARVNNLYGTTFIQPLNDNLFFVTNVVENLTGSRDLIGLRSRGRSTRPLTYLANIERAAMKKGEAKMERLSQTAQEASAKLSQIQDQTRDARALDEAFLEERERLLKERADVNRQLRELNRELREEVDAVIATVKVFSIGGAPLLVALVALGIALIQQFRRRRTQ